MTPWFSSANAKRAAIVPIVFAIWRVAFVAADADRELAHVRTLRQEGAGTPLDAARVEETCRRLDEALTRIPGEGRLSLLRAEFESWRLEPDLERCEQNLRAAEADLPARARVSYGFHLLAAARGEDARDLERLERCLVLDPTHVEIAKSVLPHVFAKTLDARGERSRWLALYEGFARTVAAHDPTRLGSLLQGWDVLTGSGERPTWVPRGRETRLSAAHHDLVCRNFVRSRAWALELLPDAPLDGRIYTYFALAALGCGDESEARAAARLALRRDVSRPDALNALARHVDLEDELRDLLGEEER